MKTTEGCLQGLIEKASKEELLKRFGNKRATTFKKGDKEEKKETPEKKEEKKETPEKKEEK